jgi:hypothetical protein
MTPRIFSCWVTRVEMSDRSIRGCGSHCWRSFLPLALILFAARLSAQEGSPYPPPLASSEYTEPASFDSQCPPESTQPAQPGTSSSTSGPKPAGAKPAEQSTPPANREPPRILGVVPNFRAVSAGTIPPPPTPKEAFVIATKNSFDYSSFIFVGLTSAMAEGTHAHPQLGKGLRGFGRYYWRGLVDKTDGNYLVIFALPTVLHQDERYYALGKGGFWERLAYSVSRVAITPNYEGHGTFNASELLGRGIAQGISLGYYPSQTRTLEGISSKYGYAILRDALTNTFREFWPDIAVHVLHRHP